MIDKIFSKEKRYSIFYIILPMLLWIEGLFYLVLSPNSSSVSGFLLGLIKITTNENIKNKEAYLPELIVLGNVDFTWDEGKEYKIEYLKNTGIVVEIKETTVIIK